MFSFIFIWYTNNFFSDHSLFDQPQSTATEEPADIDILQIKQKPSHPRVDISKDQSIFKVCNIANQYLVTQSGNHYPIQCKPIFRERYCNILRNIRICRIILHLRLEAANFLIMKSDEIGHSIYSFSIF